MSSYNLIASFFLLALAFSSLANASCKGPLQDFCVAIDEPKNAVFVNGRLCKNPDNVTVNDFVFSGFGMPADTNNSLGFNVTSRGVNQVAGLNHQGISMIRVDFAMGGVDPPHWHPRSAELFHVHQGKVMAGFVASAENNYTNFFTTLREGEGIVIPHGLSHFAMNVGKGPAVAFLGYNHQNPGHLRQGNSLFYTKIPPRVLAISLKLDRHTVTETQRAFQEGYAKE